MVFFRRLRLVLRRELRTLGGHDTLARRGLNFSLRADRLIDLLLRRRAHVSVCLRFSATRSFLGRRVCVSLCQRERRDLLLRRRLRRPRSFLTGDCFLLLALALQKLDRRGTLLPDRFDRRRALALRLLQHDPRVRVDLDPLRRELLLHPQGHRLGGRAIAGFNPSLDLLGLFVGDGLVTDGAQSTLEVDMRLGEF